MKLFAGLFVLFFAIVISCTAGFFSVAGLVALFAAAPVSVMIMGGTLEGAKLVASGWLKFNWDNPNTNPWLRRALVVFIINLMLITSIGIYGQLMAANLEQNAPAANIGVQTQQLELQVQQKNDENQRLQQRLTQIDQNIAVFLQNDQASRGMAASQQMRRERDQISQQIETNNQAINALNTQLAPLRMEANAVEAKLGPFKNFAELLGLPDSSAVQLVICLIMISFDPLAVVLLLAALQTLREHFDERRRKKAGEWDDFFDATPSDPDPDLIPTSAAPNPDVSHESSDPHPDAVHESSMPNPTLSSLDAAYNPMEMVDDYFFTRALEPEHVKVWLRPAPQTEDADETIVRLAGLRPEAEREFIAEAIPSTQVEEEEADTKIVDRDTLIDILERNPGILNEIEDIIEQEVVEEMTDREKLLDLLEKNPSIIQDMAAILTSQITKSDTPPLGDSWLKD